jgi:hypothetical protein
MTLSDIASIATIIEAIFVMISVYFIWRELRENVKLTRASNNQALVEISSPFNMQLIQDRHMAEMWVSGAKKYAEMDDVDKYRYKSLLIWWLILHENIYYQYLGGLLDRSAYMAWDYDLDEFVHTHKLWFYWEEMKSNFQADFATHVSQITEKHKLVSTAEERRNKQDTHQSVSS